jgi:hypothetical protein
MVELEKELEKYSLNGEKTGWTYVFIEQSVAEQLKPDTRTWFRVKGWIDSEPVKQLALAPIGEGNFILPVNGQIRRKIRKEVGQKVKLRLEPDDSELEISEDLLACLEDEPVAKEFFESLTKGHQRYFSTWIESAKTIETRTKRITQSIFGLSHQMDYGQMYRHFKKKNQDSG